MRTLNHKQVIFPSIFVHYFYFFSCFFFLNCSKGTSVPQVLTQRWPAHARIVRKHSLLFIAVTYNSNNVLLWGFVCNSNIVANSISHITFVYLTTQWPRTKGLIRVFPKCFHRICWIQWQKYYFEDCSAWTCFLLCEKPAFYLSATRTLATEKIFNWH